MNDQVLTGLPTNHPMGLDALTVRIPRFDRVQGVVEDAASLNALAVIYGDPGLGKTWAIGEAARRQARAGRRVAFVTLPEGARSKPLVESLASQLTGVRQDDTQHHLIEIVRRELAEGDDAIVFIDEVQGLHGNCIEVARYLLDDPRSRFGLVLCGGRGAYEYVRRHAHLRSRLDFDVPFAPMDLAETLGFLVKFHPYWGMPDPEFVEILDRNHCRGELRAWAKITAHAVRNCRVRDLELIDHSAIAYALRQLKSAVPPELRLAA